MKSFITLSIALSLLIPCSSIAQWWQIEEVDTVGEVGEGASLALDSSNNPHISYYDETNHDLKYAKWDGSDWQFEVVDGEFHTIKNTSLALDSLDRPRICYNHTWPVDEEGIKYAYWNGSNWEIEMIQSGDCGSNSIAIDSYDRPHIIYGYGYGIRYARWDGSEWLIEFVGGPYNPGSGGSLVLDGNDRPHVAYRNKYDGDLMYAWHDGLDWHLETVGADDDVSYTSIMLDGYGRPHISYIYDDFLKYAYYDGSDWYIEWVSQDPDHFARLRTSIDIDAQGRPHISFYNSSDDDLDYAYRDEYGWHVEPVDVDGNVGRYSSIRLDTSDYPRISYYAVGSRDLRYARYGYLDVDVIYFDAYPYGGKGLILNWAVEITDKDDFAGFNIYRRLVEIADVKKPNPAGLKTEPIWRKVNVGLITGENPYTYVDCGLEGNTTYEYKLEAVIKEKPEVLGYTVGTVGSSFPKTCVLYQSRPNPTKGTGVITFALPEDNDITLNLFDITGREIATLVEGIVSAGEHEVSVSDLAPGVYVYRLEAGEFSAARKMVVVR